MYCNLPNELLNTKELKKIERHLRNNKKLANFESLKNIILSDEKILENKQITFDQIKNFMESLKLYIKKKASVVLIHEHSISKINKRKNFLDNFYTFEKKRDSNFNLELDNLEINKYDLLNFDVQKITLFENNNNNYGYKLNLFGSDYLVKIIEYNNLEHCPFHSDNINFIKHDKFNQDWLIYNLDKKLCMCLNTLIFHQIITHHFFQSPSSVDRIEPIDLIELFNLKPEINYKIKTKEIEYYPFCSGNTSTDEEKIEVIHELIKNSDYILSIVSKLDGKIYYHIKLINLDYKKKIILNKIEFEKTNFINTYYNLEKNKKYIEIDE